MKILVFIPTFNEAENIVPLIEQILADDPQLEILVVDDDSPDGTGKLVEKNFSRERRVSLVTRREKRGRGLAGLLGFQEACRREADVLLEMDADFSHSPEFIPRLLAEIDTTDLVIGSRFIKGGQDKERGLLRGFISYFARIFISALLGVRVKDPTSGFRAFRGPVLEHILPHLRAEDPFIIAESLYWVNRHGFSIKEIPIYFYNRRKGKSKLNFKILFTYLMKTYKLNRAGKRINLDKTQAK